MTIFIQVFIIKNIKNNAIIAEITIKVDRFLLHDYLYSLISLSSICFRYFPIIQIINMGAMCKYETCRVQQQHLSRKYSVHVEVNDHGEKIDFIITNESLKDVRSDRLIIFTDSSINLKKNDHFFKLPAQAIKLESMAVRYMKKNQGNNALPYITLKNNTITTLPHIEITLIFIDIWKENDEQKDFQKLMTNFFSQLKQVRCIAITQFPHTFGYSLKHKMNIVIKELVKISDRPSKIKLCCLNQDSKQLIQRLVQQSRNDIAKTVVQSQSANDHHY